MRGHRGEPLHGTRAEARKVCGGTRAWAADLGCVSVSPNDGCTWTVIYAGVPPLERPVAAYLRENVGGSDARQLRQAYTGLNRFTPIHLTGYPDR